MLGCLGQFCWVQPLLGLVGMDTRARHIAWNNYLQQVRPTTPNPLLHPNTLRCITGLHRLKVPVQVGSQRLRAQQGLGLLLERPGSTIGASDCCVVEVIGSVSLRETSVIWITLLLSLCGVFAQWQVTALPDHVASPIHCIVLRCLVQNVRRSHSEHSQHKPCQPNICA